MKRFSFILFLFVTNTIFSQGNMIIQDTENQQILLAVKLLQSSSYSQTLKLCKVGTSKDCKTSSISLYGDFTYSELKLNIETVLIQWKELKVDKTYFKEKNFESDIQKIYEQALKDRIPTSQLNKEREGGVIKIHENQIYLYKEPEKI